MKMGKNELEYSWLVAGPDPRITIKKSKLGFLGKKDKVERVFGWENSILYAKEQPQNVIESPENYAFYAAMMFWSNFWWITGKAQTVAEVVQQAEGAEGWEYRD